MIKTITHPCVGTCSRQVEIELEDGIIRRVAFTGGCSGNTQGVAALVRGMKSEEAIARLEGIDCHGKGTSCPDQLAKALKTALLQPNSGTDFAWNFTYKPIRKVPCIIFGISY